VIVKRDRKEPGIPKNKSPFLIRGFCAGKLNFNTLMGDRFIMKSADPGVEEEGSPIHDLYETVTFSDSTSISGDISTFSKTMNYNGVIDTYGDICKMVRVVIPEP
jgi:hypothetical protein